MGGGGGGKEAGGWGGGGAIEKDMQHTHPLSVSSHYCNIA